MLDAWWPEEAARLQTRIVELTTQLHWARLALTRAETVLELQQLD